MNNFFSGIFNIEGKRVRIRFEGGGAHAKGMYTTNDEKIQEAIESSDQFQRKIITIERYYSPKEEKVSKKIEIVEASPVQGFKIYKDVEKVQEAANILKLEYGLDHNSVKSREKVLAEAQRLNLKFPKLEV